MIYKHNEILPNHKKNEILTFAATFATLEIIILSEVRERQILYITYVWNLKKYK